MCEVLSRGGHLAKNMKYLGLDYGERKVGLAVGDSESKLAVPLKTIRFTSINELLKKVEQTIEAEQVEKIVLGISEGQMAEKTRKFAKILEQKINMPVIFQDETLTTKDAQRLSIEAGIKRKKRKFLEDAYSAALIMQAYFDTA